MIFQKIKKNKEEGGFTLIELLVVISIIALLSSIVLSSITQARQRARFITAVAQHQDIRDAMLSYKIDNGVYPTLTVYGCNMQTWNQLMSALVNGGYVTDEPDLSLIKIGNSPCLLVEGPLAPTLDEYRCEGFGNLPYLFYFFSNDDLEGYFPRTFRADGEQGSQGANLMWCFHVPIQ